MEKKTYIDLAELLTRKHTISDVSSQIFVNKMFQVISNGLLADGIVKVRGLGTFKLVEVDDRESIDVNTGERVMIPGHYKVSFTCDSTMKEIVNKPFSQFETVILNDGVDFSSIETPAETDEPPFEDDDVIQNEEPTVQVVEQAVVIDESTKEIIEETSTEETSTEDTSTEETPAIEESLATVDIPMEEEESVTDVEQETEEVSVIEDTIVEEAPTVQVETIEQTEVPTIEETSETKEVSETEESTEAEEMEEPQEEEEPTVEEPQEEESVEVFEQEEEEPVEDEEPVTNTVVADNGKKHVLGYIILSLILLLFVAAAYYGGYLYGYQKGRADVTMEIHQKILSDKMKAQHTPASVDSTVVDSITNTATTPVDNQTKPVAEETKPKEQPAATDKEITKHDASIKAEQKTPVAEDMHARYAAMDVRVRLGAYRIVGTDHEVTVKSGDNVKKISRRCLGEGMECYVEVYNGIKSDTPLKIGQKIKIPKLVVKKKKK